MSDAPRGNLTVHTLTMPADTNPNGDIFGAQWAYAREGA
jgi:acyl-CoA hydrolase